MDVKSSATINSCTCSDHQYIKGCKIPIYLNDEGPQYIMGCKTSIQFDSFLCFIFPVIKNKEYNKHVMLCAPFKEVFIYRVSYSSECFTMSWDSKNRVYLVGLPFVGF